MAMTHDYLDQLDEAFAIAPAGSQEEYLASETIAGLMGQHRVQVSVEEFETSSISGLVPGVLSILAFVGLLLAGAGSGLVRLIGLLLALIPGVIVVLGLIGRAPSFDFGPAARSQNVIAFHPAEGPNVTKGSRRIVVVAHYDTPHEDFLRTTPLAPYLPLITKASYWCGLVVSVCALLDCLTFLPSGFRILVLIVGVVASVPPVLLAVQAIYQRFSPCSEGANDNKSGVAALLGVLEKVSPSGAVPRDRAAEAAQAAAAAEAEEPLAEDDEGSLYGGAALSEGEGPATAGDMADEGAYAPVPETGPAFVPTPEAPAPEAAAPESDAGEVVGLRHGAEAIRYYGVLPESCEIVYDLPRVEAAPAAAGHTDPAYLGGEGFSTVGSGADVRDDLYGEEDDASARSGAQKALGVAKAVWQTVKGLALKLVDAVRGLVAKVGSKDASDAPEGEEGYYGEPTPGSAPADELATDEFYAVNEGFETDATNPVGAPVDAGRPSDPTDPSWGTTEYRPEVSDVARRASLFDLPDLDDSQDDPFAGGPDSTQRAQLVSVPPVDTEEAYPAAGQSAAGQEPLSTIGPDGTVRGEEPKKGFFGRVFGGGKGSKSSPTQDSEDDGWYDDDTDGTWRGGATTRSGLRLMDEEGGLDESELVDAALSLGDDDLVAHDIWFVALGASSLDHAGMRDFLAQHRREVRGSFVINLDGVGAGQLAVLTHEGLVGTRRADRRLVRMLTQVADDIHLPLDKVPLDWASTDATPSMRSSLRSVTVTGLGEDGLRALSHTADDTLPNVSGDQAESVVQLVCELIRRS